MNDTRFGVGVVGLTPGRSWGAIAHVPALRAVSDRFDLLGVANSSLQSSRTAAEALDIPRAYGNFDEMLADPDIDVVSVTVKIPAHFDLVRRAIDAGKNVYCEWALGKNLEEARQLADMARGKGVIGVVGTQALYAPEVEHARRLISEGFIGQVLSSTLVGSGGSWGSEMSQANAYTADVANGATLLTIPFGHTIAAVQSVLGDISEVSALLANRRHSTRVIESQQEIPMTSPDQLLVNGTCEGGACLSVHYRGGQSRGTPLLWEINGTEGDLQISGPTGHLQLAPLTLRGANGAQKELEVLDVPRSPITGPEATVRSENVAQVYARLADDLRDGTRTAPTFDDGVRLHSLLAAIEESAETGTRVQAGTI